MDLCKMGRISPLQFLLEQYPHRIVVGTSKNLLDFPDSLFFYPIFGFVVEVLFHMLPLALLLFILTSMFNLGFEKVIWPCILVVALLEPIFQTVLGFSRPYPTWVMVCVFANILLINLFQLSIFKRYDFVSMYFFRLVYYAIWHIVWGQVRLNLLF